MVPYDPSGAFCMQDFFIGNFLQNLLMGIMIELTIDRFIFIKKPLHYPLIMTPLKIWGFLFVAFLTAIVIAFGQILTAKVKT